MCVNIPLGVMPSNASENSSCSPEAFTAGLMDRHPCNVSGMIGGSTHPRILCIYIIVCIRRYNIYIYIYSHILYVYIYSVYI